MKRFVVMLSLSAILHLPPPGRSQESAKTDVEFVKYDRLKKIIRDNRGKVVVVDFWASWSGPCKRCLYKLADLHKEHGKDGLVIVTVNADEQSTETREEQRKWISGFLARLKVEFINVILDDNVWPIFGDTRFEALSCVFVFDRHGKRVCAFECPDPENVKELVIKLLQEKQ